MITEIVTKKVDKIRFGVLSPKHIRRMGIVNVVTPELYDADGYPVEKGLMDLNMGVIDPGLRCKTCGGGLKTCQGHFGYIQLARPVIHILYIKQIYDFLRGFCGECGRILLTPKEIEEWAAKIQDVKQNFNIEILLQHKHQLMSTLQKKKKCYYCNTEVRKIKFVRPMSFFDESTRLWPTDINSRLERIPDEDLEILGYESRTMRPEWLVLTLLPVPPIVVRPSITLETGERSEDDLTHKLSDIVRVNQRLLENINAGAPEIIIEDLWDLLQYHITTFFNNKISQIPPARHRTNRELKTLVQRLSGKEGRFRHNLAGKRVNFCGRSVISPDVNIKLNEVGVPLMVAKEITIPEKVTEWNTKWLKSFIKSKEYPSANYVITEDGKRRKVTEDTVPDLLEELQPGWIVERNLLDGDIVLFNRQPSLHRLSMQGHKVRVTPGKTFRINPSVCLPYNADFDGDEMNLHAPQTEEARSEAENILKVDYNIITPRYGLSIIGETKDALFGTYILTDKLEFTREKAAELLLSAGIDKELPKPTRGDIFTGKQIFSLLLPKNCNFKRNDIEIRKGLLTSGIITEKHIGPEGGLLVHYLVRKYGSKRTMQFLNGLQQLALAVVRKLPYTLSLYDLDLSPKLRKKIENIVLKAYNEVKRLIKQFRENKITQLPGRSMQETMEAMILSTLNSARNTAGELIGAEMKEESNLMKLIKSKTGGKVLNLVQVSGFVGQQALRGKRIISGYKNRALSHFKSNDIASDAGGFVKASFSDGLQPLELFFNAVVGRDSYIDTAMRTPKSGYMQRRLINALQDLKVTYDGTVRDSSQQIIQFAFGGDNIDVSKSDHGGIRVS